MRRTAEYKERLVTDPRNMREVFALIPELKDIEVFAHLDNTLFYRKDGLVPKEAAEKLSELGIRPMGNMYIISNEKYKTIIQNLWDIYPDIKPSIVRGL